MQFDLFHSVGRIDSLGKPVTDQDVFRNFLDQAELAEKLQFGTVWVAESHFSSEVQKKNSNPVIPNYRGEVGLNCDSPQLFQFLAGRTQRIGFGTAIFNIVGGNGGPIGAADRVRSMNFLNHLLETPRKLSIGVASGRFPYINQPYGIVPRSPFEQKNWKDLQRYILAEALEIFLRLSCGETLGSDATASFEFQGEKISKRWTFEPLKLVPELPKRWQEFCRFVLGTADPIARDHALQFADCDIFNLSFTPPAQIEKIHADMQIRYEEQGRKWNRSRLPRTVLVFIDEQAERARQRASQCLDTYIEAMRGTAQVPVKEELMARALIGDPIQIAEQLSPGASHGFQDEDRLMLWFEFNQWSSKDVQDQMVLFAEKVAPKFSE